MKAILSKNLLYVDLTEQSIAIFDANKQLVHSLPLYQNLNIEHTLLELFSVIPSKKRSKSEVHFLQYENDTNWTDEQLVEIFKNLGIRKVCITSKEKFLSDQMQLPLESKTSHMVIDIQQSKSYVSVFEGETFFTIDIAWGEKNLLQSIENYFLEKQLSIPSEQLKSLIQVDIASEDETQKFEFQAKKQRSDSIKNVYISAREISRCFKQEINKYILIIRDILAKLDIDQLISLTSKGILINQNLNLKGLDLYLSRSLNMLCIFI